MPFHIKANPSADLDTRPTRQRSISTRSIQGQIRLTPKLPCRYLSNRPLSYLNRSSTDWIPRVATPPDWLLRGPQGEPAARRTSADARMPAGDGALPPAGAAHELSPPVWMASRTSAQEVCPFDPALRVWLSQGPLISHSLETYHCMDLIFKECREREFQ